MKRRFLAMLLSLLMVFAMLPVSAFAADDFDEESVDVELTEGEEEGDNTPAETTSPAISIIGFYGDGAIAKTKFSQTDCERDTLMVRATGLDTNKSYRITLRTPNGKYFATDKDKFNTTETTNISEKLISNEVNPITNCASVGYYCTLRRWSGSQGAPDTDVKDGALAGTYTVNLYEETAGSGEGASPTYGTAIASATFEIVEVTVDFNTTSADVTSLITQSENKAPQYFFNYDAKDTTKATFFANATDLEVENKSAREVLTSLLTIAKSGEGDNATEQYTDGNGKMWVYDDTTTPTFTYADVVTIKAATDDKNVTVAASTTVLKKADETFEVSVTPNYLPTANGVTFTLKTAGSTGATTTNAVWTGKLTNLDEITTAEVSVSATEAVSVKAAATGIDFPSANVVTDTNAATKIAMFAITPADNTTGTKATANIIVTSEKQPEVTSPANYGIFVVDNAEDKTWKLTKEDAKAEEITVGLKDDIKSIDDLTATATREAKQGGGATIKLAVDDEDVTSFKYKASDTEAEKPEPGAKAGEAYTLYDEAGFDYVAGNDYVEVVTVNDYDEITAWGLAVIPKEKAEVVQTPTVTGTDGNKTATADVDKKDVDTALEAAIQATPAQGETTTTAKLDFTTDGSGNEVKADNAEITIPAESIDKVVEHNDKAETEEDATPVSVAIATPAGDVVADPAVLDAIQKTEAEEAPSGATEVSTKVVLSIKKDTVTEGTTDVPKTDAESFNIEFKKVTTYTPAGGGDPQTKTATVEVKTEVTVTVPTSVEPKAGNTLFAYFMKAADKLFYVGTATKEGTRATFTAPHLSTYVLYAEKVPGDIGVSRVISESEEGTVQETIIFDENREHTINLEEGETSVTLYIPSTIDLTCEVSADGTYNSTTGVFALKSGKPSATLTFTEGEGDDAITYTLILNAATTGDDEETKTPVTETDGKVTVGDGEKPVSWTGSASNKTANVQVPDAGSTVSFYAAANTVVTLKNAAGDTIKTATAGTDGKVELTGVKPGNTAEFTIGGTTYVMTFTPETSTSTGNFTIKVDDVGLGDAGLGKMFKGVTIENTTSGKVYVVEVIDSKYAGGTANNLLIMDGNGSDVHFYLLNSVTKIKVWEVDENDVLTASGNINALLLDSPATEETF